MKKMVCLLLVVLMVLSMTSCGKTDTTSKKKTNANSAKITDTYSGKFRVGFGRRNITPDYLGVPLQGFGNVDARKSQGCSDYIYTNCIAISDEKDNTVLFIAIDSCGIADAYATPYRKSISSATGVPVDNIILNASHTHSAPSVSSGNAEKSPMIAQYRRDLAVWLVEAAVESLNDRAPSKVAVADTEAVGLSFIRHYFDVNGLCFGDNHNSISHADPARHTTNVDPTMHVLKFDRSQTKEKKDVYFFNWRAHPTRNGAIKEYDISADTVGQMRIAFEEATGALCSYYQGAAGNINSTTKIASEATYPSDYVGHGKALAEYAVAASKNMTNVKSGNISVKTDTITASINHKLDNMVPFAKEVQAVFTKTNEPHEAQRLAMTQGLYSVYHCNAIVLRAGMAATGKIPISSVAIGNELAFTFVPYEMFDTNSVYIEDNSPYKYTFVQGYSNGALGYIPSAYGFEYGCYESDTCKYVPGTGETIADTLLKELKASKSGK